MKHDYKSIEMQGKTVHDNRKQKKTAKTGNTRKKTSTRN